jgi:predicted nucleic-acid-binding Zn-ribbon protein
MIGKSAMSYLPSNTTIQKRYYRKAQHCLSKIDLERKTALCTACGYIEIHVAKSRSGQPIKLTCIRKYQEILDEARRRGREKQLLRPGWKPRHLLTQLDTKQKTAICAVCGPTEIYPITVEGKIYYQCLKRNRAFRKDKWRADHPPANRKAYHRLFQVDLEKRTAVCALCGPVEIYLWQRKNKTIRRCRNTVVPPAREPRKNPREINANLISQYKVDHGCRCCGQKENDLLLNLYRRDKSKVKIEGLLKLRPEYLMQELAKCEVLCVNCTDPSLGHQLVNVDLDQRTAICSTCGRTDLVIFRDRQHPHRSPTICCGAQRRENNRNSIRRYRAKKRLTNPGPLKQPPANGLHRLSEIDREKMTAVCSICGPTDIFKSEIKSNRTYYRCATQARDAARKYSRSHYRSIKAKRIQPDVVGD